ASHRPDDGAPLVKIPEWLLARLTQSPAEGGAKNRRSLSAKICQGSRNATLTSLAGAMRRRGMSEAAIVAALCAENEERCEPSLDIEEVRAIAASVARYEPHVEASRAETSGTLPVIDIANAQFREKVSRAIDAMHVANGRNQEPRFFQ